MNGGIVTMNKILNNAKKSEELVYQIYFYTNNQFYFNQFSWAWMHSLNIKNSFISNNSV